MYYGFLAVEQNLLFVTLVPHPMLLWSPSTRPVLRVQLCQRRVQRTKPGRHKEEILIFDALFLSFGFHLVGPTEIIAFLTKPMSFMLRTVKLLQGQQIPH